jgi:hypothetical protein
MTSQATRSGAGRARATVLDEATAKAVTTWLKRSTLWPQSQDASRQRSGGFALQRVCFRARIRADRLAEYRQQHQQVWPEMLAALHEASRRKYSPFLVDNGLLIGYLETDDFDAARRDG